MNRVYCSIVKGLIYQILFLVIILFLGFKANAQSCTHTIYLTDTYGDGWNGNYASVSVNGVTVLSNITLSSGAGPVTYNFSASAGDVVRVWRTITGSWTSECQVRVLSSTGATVIPQQTLTTGSAASGGNTGTGACASGGGGGAGCTHTLYCTDTYGDGWNGNRASVSVNGVTVLSNVTLNSGYGPVTFNFTAAAGATIRVWRSVTGSYTSECRVRVLSSTGATVIPLQTLATGSASSGGNTGTGACAAPAPTAPCTNSSAYGTFNAPTLPGSNLISSCTYQSEYNTIYSVVAGQQYQSSYSLGGYITVRHSSFNGTVVAHGNSPLNWTAPISGTYYIHYNTNNNCGTASSCGSSYISCLSCSAPSPPVNDLVCNSTNISCGQTISGTTVNATNSGTGEAGSCGVSQTQPGVWYVVSGNGQTMTASLCATAWDSKISVYSGANCSSLSCVGGNDDFGPSCSSSSASYTWNTVSGTNYYILVHGYSASSAFNLGLTCVTPPPAAPTSVSASVNAICSGGTTTLTANGAQGTVYWYTGGCGVTQIGTGNSISVSPGSTTTYYARNYNNGLFSTTCASTTVTVNAAPIVSAGGNQSVCLGSPVTLSGSGASSYAWNNGVSNGVSFTPNTTNTYTVTGTNSFGCTGTAQVTVTVNPSISWANLQWPATATVNCGSGTNVYGQVYEASLTPSVGANNTIGVQIGISTTNTNPLTWPAAAWSNASYNAQVGNNDEYVANVGSSLASGTYYYAFRYTTGASGCYVYGGYNASGGGYWNGTTNVNGVLTVGGIDWANLQFPGSGSVCQGQPYTVYGQVYEAGVTNNAGATVGLIAEIGVSNTNTDPSTWAANVWSPASFNVQSGNNDEFTATISNLNSGTYYYTFRYKLSNACSYQYGGFNAGGGGFWNGTTNVNGTLTVTTPPVANAGLDIIDPSTCGKNTVTLAATALTAGQSGAWTLVSGTNANGIFSLPTSPNTQFTGSYGGSYVLQWALTSGGCTGTDQVTVTFNQPSDASISALIGSGDLLWCGLTNTDWSTSTNWYQKQAAGHYVRMSGAVQPAINNEVFTLSTANGGLCIGNSTPSLSINSNAEDVYVGTGVTLNLSNDSINIAQNLVNNGTIIASTGIVNFTGSSNSTISGSGNTQLFNMRVNKSAGATLTLQQPVLVTNNLNMVQGNVFTTSANLLTLGTSSAAPGSLTYNSGTIVGPFKRYFANAASAGTGGLFPVGTAVYNRYADFSFGSGPGVDQFLTVEYKTGAPMQGGIPLYNGLPLMASGSMIQNYSADGYWSVIPTNNNYTSPITGVPYSVTLFANNLTGMQSPQVCRIIKSAGSNTAAQHHVAWQACGTHTPINGAANPQSFLITSTATQGFSWFNIGTPNSQALPVELLSFNGDCNEGQVNLSWQTATEHNSDYFEVEKSRDGMNWQVLTTVNAAGNSTQLLNYEAVDAHAMEGNNYYRLTQVDIDGTTKTYDVINVSCSGAAKGYFSAYPNPSTGSFQVILNDKNLVGSGILSVKDTKGSELLNRTIEVKPGINMFSVTDLNLAPGVYYIQIVNGERATEVLKEVIR